eukprot:TRINITY_DN5943_c0_g1_i1.p1 TRINITY_DN5943_c0_g1~~TRINITY_DN5943_c0_g1_i1.p1  ORF type:complete len:112 (-),score=9.84 TRINITY_DN5943_c0_g1_i1:59-394(-)
MNIENEEDLLPAILPGILREDESNWNKIRCDKATKLIVSNLSDPECFADQVTLMDYRIFSCIEARECIAQSWKKKNNKKLAPHILGIIQQFNNLTMLVQVQILRQKTKKKK